MKLFDVYPIYDLQPVNAHGAYLTDLSGAEYLDFYGGHAVISIGHSHPHYVYRVEQQLKAMGFYSNSVVNPLQEELAALLGTLSGYPDYQLFLVNSGAEANENALKLASFATGKKSVVSFDKSFHGRTSACVAVTDNPKIRAPINYAEHVTFLPFEDLKGVEAVLSKNETCAVIIEGIQGIAGINMPSEHFFKGLKTLCDQYGVVLILDEIQSGYGRTGKFFAHQYADIQADIITVAKGMGNGFPMGGVIISPSFEASYGLLGTTFGGNHLACAAGLAVLEILQQERLIENAQSRGIQLKQLLSKIDAVKEVKGHGLMLGIEFDFPVKSLRQHLLFKEKIFVGSSSDPNILRLLPPLCIGDSEIDQLIEGLTNSLKNEELLIH